MKRIALVAVFAASVGYLALRVFPTGDAAAAIVAPPDVGVIRGISIDGGRGLPLARLRAAISTQVGAPVEPERLEGDRRAIERLLAERGFLGAKVATATVTTAPDGAYVVFDVARGPLYRVRSVRLVGDGWHDAGVVTLAIGDEAAGERLARIRQIAQDTLVRADEDREVVLAVVADPSAPAVDVTLAIR